MPENKVALVTGAAGGIGQAVVLRLLEDGFTVAAMDINEGGLATLSGSAKGKASALTTWPCDQTDERQTRDAVAKIESRLGPVEGLVNTIGWVGTSRFADEDSAYWRKVIAINLEVRPVCDPRRAQGHGRAQAREDGAFRLGRRPSGHQRRGRLFGH